jgi:hypothetical protein
MNGFGVVTVPPADIESLKQRELAGEFLKRGQTRTIKLGTQVWVIAGVLQGQKGTVITRLRSEVVRVELNGLGTVTLGTEYLSEQPPPAA